MNYSSYTKIILALLLLFSLSVIGLNAVVDPLNLYQIADIKGVNHFKPKYGTYSTSAKPAQIDRFQYERITFGSSRVKLGIPVHIAPWAKQGSSGFNAGINGTDVALMSQLFHHTLATNKNVKSIVMVTDFFMFNAHSRRSIPSSSTATANDTDWDKTQLRLRYHANALFSPQITNATIYTLRKQKDPKYNKFLSTGQSNPERERNKALKNSYKMQFENFEGSILDRGWSPCQNGEWTYQMKGTTYHSMQTFTGMLEAAREQGIEVKLFISPIHARLMEYLELAGYWDEYENWKTDLTQQVADVNQKNLSAPAVALWDFSGYTSVTTEDLPDDLITPMVNYYDSSHFSNEVGERIVNVLFASKEAAATSAQDFGVLLTPDTLPAHLNKVRQQKKAYRATHQEQFKQQQKKAAYALEQRSKKGRICH